MPVSFRSNIPSLNAQTQLGRTTKQLSDTYAKLAAGTRITKASDDPSGLALADYLRAHARVAAVAIRNANDGISLTSVAESGLDAIKNTLTRMAELAATSANGTETSVQRSALSSEFLALGSEIDRIAKTVTFNNINLLSNSGSVQFQLGFDGANSNNYFSLQSVLGTLDSLGLANGGTSNLTYSILTISDAGSIDASLRALSAVRNAMDSITTRRGIVGAAESRLTVALDYLTMARENFAAAESKIRDVDVAQEVANMTRLQIIQQSATAILAQANQQPTLVLELLR